MFNRFYESTSHVWVLELCRISHSWQQRIFSNLPNLLYHKLFWRAQNVSMRMCLNTACKLAMQGNSKENMYDKLVIFIAFQRNQSSAHPAENEMKKSAEVQLSVPNLVQPPLFYPTSPPAYTETHDVTSVDKSGGPLPTKSAIWSCYKCPAHYNGTPDYLWYIKITGAVSLISTLLKMCEALEYSSSFPIRTLKRQLAKPF